MYKVLLVDDEELELKGIRMLVPWNELQMEVVGACNDGFSALQFLNENEVDVLVSDIRMPIMTGIELAGKAQTIRPGLKIVFVSGHEDFNYAKGAIAVNASSYVLKPVGDAEIFEALSGVRSTLIRERNQQQWEQSLKQSMSYFLFRGKNSGTGFAPTFDIAQASPANLDAIVESLLVAMANHELERMKDFLDELFFNVKQIGSDKAALQGYVTYIVSKLDTFLNDLNEDLSVILERDAMQVDQLFQYDDIHAFHGWLTTTISLLANKLQSKQQRKNMKLIREIELYIDTRLHQNVTLRELATAFSFSPNYLGQLFKEETDEHFSDFMTRKRVEKAKLLLKDTSLKVYEVADQIGCGSLAYFSKLFKDATGMTPGDYRKRS
ncbi:response regulator transcription factor [Paenibacillus sp. 2TAB19]|uniref:response regulator transcription factor n=1 Tax=Paenibacillus sp. 2TAB19 TaxID=3233003 RepID=UPI003F996709